MVVDLKQKYEEERKKRQELAGGLGQYLDKQHSAAFLVDDPWVASGTPVHRPVPDGGHCKIVVFGAGFAGLLAAIKCLDSGAAKSPSDILIVDPAGSFGGTWYWNRYPGLMCDVESYTYLPLLEETGYMPTRRYAGGEEIRKYNDLMAKQWHLEDRAMFQSAGRTTTWESDHWVCEIVEKPKGLPEQTVTIHADYVFLASGAFTYPKIPQVRGVESFQGQMLHTARWNYDVTGGSQTSPVLDKLADKRVAIIGTGATAIQVVPELAKYAKELVVVQRTPSAVGYRGNRDTDLKEWKTKIAFKKGWQAERMTNLQILTEQLVENPAAELVEDGFCSMPSISGTFGGPSDLTPEDTPKILEHLHGIDDARSNEIRERALETVKDPDTGKKLQAWYPGWCKRPTFHDEYLPAFNRPNVRLVDTDGRGLQSITPTSIHVNDQEHPVDIIVWSTGYGSPLINSLAGKAEMAVRGRSGQDMEQLNQTMDFKTLHGIVAHDFPNLFFPGLNQAGVGVNQVQRLVAQTEQIAYIIAAAEQKTKKPVIEPTEAACEAWGDQLAGVAHLTAAMLACTPGYFTLEGDAARLPVEVLPKLARTGVYGRGLLEYLGIMDQWREKGDMQGLDVSAAAAA